MRALVHRRYGEGPLHLLASLAMLLVVGAAGVALFQSFPGPTVVQILLWFLGAAVAHDLLVLPVYSLLDRVALGAMHRHAPDGSAPEHVPGAVYVRVPMLLSGLLLLTFFPEILRLGNDTFHTASGLSQHVFLARYLAIAGFLFLASAVAYAVALARGRRRAVTAP